MDMGLVQSIPKLRSLPASLPVEGAIRIELQEGIPVLRASSSVQARVETLLHKQRESRLSVQEVEEFDRYEEIDDYLSLLNRLVRNLFQARPAQKS
jgi:DNA/RNA-binding domain of Phe-tRNA-synthetase-like protein